MKETVEEEHAITECPNSKTILEGRTQMEHREQTIKHLFASYAKVVCIFFTVVYPKMNVINKKVRHISS